MTVEDAHKILSAFDNIDYEGRQILCDRDFKAIKTSVKALEKQMPKMTIEGDEHSKCPVCNSDVLPYVQNFCEYCGQAIATDWGE